MHRVPLAAAISLSLLLVGCSLAAAPSAGDAQAAAPATASVGLPTMTVHKHEGCGCCNVWIEHMRKAGFTVEAQNVDDMEPIKLAAGVPPTMGSCHTAKIAGYFVEGHVPAVDIVRLLRERPEARGITVPGMPLGSPGMEHPDGIVQPYAVLLVLADGSTREFSRHPQD